MSLKGKVFTIADLSKHVRSKPDAITKPLLDGLTKRYRIVALDPSADEGKREIIAEEMSARIVEKLPEKARRVVPLLLRMSTEDRLALIGAFSEDGSLRNPFTIL